MSAKLNFRAHQYNTNSTLHKAQIEYFQFPHRKAHYARKLYLRNIEYKLQQATTFIWNIFGYVEYMT